MFEQETLDNLVQRLSGGRFHANLNFYDSQFDAYTSHLRQTLPGATLDTIYMVGIASLFAIIFGMIIGCSLYFTSPTGIYPFPFYNKIIGFIINIGRSIPFVVLIMLVFPLARHIVGTSIGSRAAIVPLTIAAIPFMSRVVESTLNELGHGIIEAAISAGATTKQLIFRVIIPEAAPGLVAGFTLLIINLITFSAMAGMVGGGGLGDVAISYGMNRHRRDILVYTVIILVVLVQVVQVVGTFISRKLDKR